MFLRVYEISKVYRVFWQTDPGEVLFIVLFGGFKFAS